MSHPKIAMAMWIDTLIDGSIFREWITNVGRRDATSRIAHLLCEFARRLELAGPMEEYRYELPMTQEQLADATGLQTRSREGLVERDRRSARIPDWEALREAGGFIETYLHLDQMPPRMAAHA